MNIQNHDTSHMKKVDQRVTAIDAKAYVHSMITEHSLSPAPNNWAMVPSHTDRFIISTKTNEFIPVQTWNIYIYTYIYEIIRNS